MTDKERELMEEPLLEEQQLSEEDQELKEQIYNRLEIFEQLNREYHNKAKECRKILHMDDPMQDDPRMVEKAGKHTLQLQTLKSTINNVVADQMLSMPEAKLMPETADMQDAADDLQDIVHYVIYCANNFEQLHYRRCEDYYGPGTAITQIAWDPDAAYGKGEIALIRWPLEAFLWDPTAENIQDCRAVMKVSWHPLSWYREHWPDEGRFVGSERGGVHDNIGITEGQIDAEHGDDEQRAMLIEYWWRTFNASTRRYTINVAYAAGNALLEVKRDVYDHGLYPFVVDVHDSIEGSLAGDGLVRELTPMMRYINRYMSYIDMNLRMASKGRLLVQKGSGIDREALVDWEQDVIEGDRITTDALQWLQNQPFNSSIVQMMQMLETDLKQDSGANQFTRGETTGGIVSGKAINSLIQAGGKVASMRTEQLKYGFKMIVEQIIWLMAQFYDDKRVELITGRLANRQEYDPETGEPMVRQIDTKRLFGKKGKGAVNPPPYTVQIEVSSRDPQRIANQNQMFMEAYTMSAQAQQFFPLSALFQILNLDGKDKILPVIQANETYQEQMQQLQQQVEQMGQQMEQMQQENQNLRKTATQMTNALSSIGNRRGGMANTGAPAVAGGTVPAGAEEPGAIVNSARNSMGQQTGAPLPV